MSIANSPPLDRRSPKVLTEWKNDYFNLSVRAKTTEKECSSYKSRLYAQDGVGGYKTWQSDITWYSRHIQVAKDHCAEALMALEAIHSRDRQKITSAKEKCKMSIDAYELQHSVVTEHMNEEKAWLDQESTLLEKFIDAAAAKMDYWEKRDNNEDPAYVGAGRLSSCEPSDEDFVDTSLQSLKSTILRIDADIASGGGVHGSWSASEHRAFLKAWSQAKGKTDETLRRCMEDPSLFQRREDEITTHAAWYTQHLMRIKTKRQLVQEWRDNMIQEKERRSSLESKENGDESDTNDEELRKKAAAEKKQRGKQRQEQARRKAAVKEWREDQAHKKKLEEEMAKQQEECSRKKNRTMNARLKQHVEEYKQKKLLKADKHVLPLRTVRANNQSMSKAELKKRRQRDIANAKIKLAEKQKKLQSRAK